MTCSRFTLAVGRQRRFVTQVQPVTSFPGIRADYERLLAAMSWVELLDLALPYESPAPEYWTIARSTLDALEKKEEWVPVFAWALSQLLELEGRQPDWLSCIDGGSVELEDPCWISPHAGGRIRSTIRFEYSDSFPASPEAVIALSRLPTLEEPPKRIKRGLEVCRILVELWQGILDRPLKAGKALLDSLQVAEPNE